MKRSPAARLALLLFALLLPVAPAFAAQKTLILATTTSTQDSGLLDVLMPAFEKQTGWFVKTIAVGSGQAMAMGSKGEADVLLVHSPASEEKFMADGLGVDRRLVMHNDFVVVGPAADPAGVRGMKSAAGALAKVAEKGALFLSRGDYSGTHAKEKGLWKCSGVDPAGKPFYQETGLGMGQTLSVASEKGGYTLADRATFLSLRKSLALEIVVEGEKSLLNVYHVIGVNPAKWPTVEGAGAKAFGEWMAAAPAQEMIGGYGVEKFGAPLFFPDAGKKEEDLGK